MTAREKKKGGGGGEKTHTSEVADCILVSCIFFFLGRALETIAPTLLIDPAG